RQNAPHGRAGVVAEQFAHFGMRLENGPGPLAMPDGVRLLVVGDAAGDVEVEPGEHRCRHADHPPGQRRHALALRSLLLLLLLARAMFAARGTDHRAVHFRWNELRPALPATTRSLMSRRLVLPRWPQQWPPFRNPAGVSRRVR